MNGQRNGGGRLARGDRVAVVHDLGSSWSAVLVEASAPPTLVEARSFSTSESAQFEAWLKAGKAERLVRVTPGGATIVKCVSLPRASVGESLASLLLLAEAELPESLPAHRRGAGILPRGGDGVSFGLLTGWMSRGEPPATMQRFLPETWVAPIAALAMLMGEAGRQAAIADGMSGSLSVLAVGSKRAVARTLVESAKGPEWREAAANAIAEAVEIVDEPLDPGLGAVGRGGARIEVHLDAAARADLPRRVSGASAKDDWLAIYGVALGAALAAVGDDAVNSWASLHAEAPRQRASIVESVVTWISTPRHAWAAAVVCLLVSALAPLGVAAVRSAVLTDKAAAVDEQQGRREDLAREAALYAHLQQVRWPMTKLMADIAAATPVGVTLSFLRLSPEQGMGIDGVADSAELVTSLQEALNATGLFRDARIERLSVEAGQRAEFTLSAAVVGPHVTVRAPEDFAARPLAVRLYGEGASNREFRDSSPDRNTTGRRPSAPSRQAEPEPRASRLTTPEEAPPPLTEEAISAMDRSTAMQEFAKRRSYINRNLNMDAALKERLDGEAQRLQQRMRDAAQGTT